MSLVRKAPVITITSSAYEQMLEKLYVRRSTIDALIESLEDYQVVQRSVDTGRQLPVDTQRPRVF